jgi:hypothetical protein
MTSPSSVLQSLVDQVADEILFGRGPPLAPDKVCLPAALGALVIDVMHMTGNRNSSTVERRVLGEFHSRLDCRLQVATIEDHVAAERWRLLRAGLEARFPSLH